jgi:hypothetical protein
MMRVHWPFQLVGYFPSSAARTPPIAIIIIIIIIIVIVVAVSAQASAAATTPVELRFDMTFLPESFEPLA